MAPRALILDLDDRKMIIIQASPSEQSVGIGDDEEKMKERRIEQCRRKDRRLGIRLSVIVLNAFVVLATASATASGGDTIREK